MSRRILRTGSLGSLGPFGRSDGFGIYADGLEPARVEERSNGFPFRVEEGSWVEEGCNGFDLVGVEEDASRI